MSVNKKFSIEIWEKLKEFIQIYKEKGINSINIKELEGIIEDIEEIYEMNKKFKDT